MSTRCYLLTPAPDSRFQAVYLHHDGDPDTVDHHLSALYNVHHHNLGALIDALMGVPGWSELSPGIRHAPNLGTGQQLVRGIGIAYLEPEPPLYVTDPHALLGGGIDWLHILRRDTGRIDHLGIAALPSPGWHHDHRPTTHR